MVGFAPVFICKEVNLVRPTGGKVRKRRGRRVYITSRAWLYPLAYLGET